MKRYFIGALIGFTLSLGVGAHAEVVSLINKTVDGMFQVTVDGKPLGNAIVVDNKTYLPVREFGEATGYTVTFTDTREVVMTKNQVTPTTSIPSPADNPKYARYKQVVNEIGNAWSELQTIKDKIAENKNSNQNVDDLNKQVSDKQTQYDNLVAEKHTLETELFPQMKK